MLHHSSSRHQRNKGSKIKTALQVTLLLGVVAWLLYQVKHSYDKKNEYLDDNEDQLTHSDRSMFQGRKEKAGYYNDGNVEKDGQKFDATAKPEEVVVNHQSESFDRHEEKSGETVFEKDNTESHEDDVRDIERSEGERVQVSNEGGNMEPHSNDADEATGNSKVANHDAEFNSEAESKIKLHSAGEDVPQDDHRQEVSTAKTNGRSHEEMAHDDESTNVDPNNANNNGSHGEEAEKNVAADSQTGTESLSDDAKTGTTEDPQNDVSSNDEHAIETLPDETGNVPSVHNENSQQDAGENQVNVASATSDPIENNTGEAVHTETGSENEGITTYSGTNGQTEVMMPADHEISKGETSESQLGNSVESNTLDSISLEEKAETGSGNGEKGPEMGTVNEVSDSKEANSEGDNSATEVSTNQAANVEMESSQGASDAGKAATSSSEETNPEENPNSGTIEVVRNREQFDMKIETRESINIEHNESQGDGSSGSNNSNDNDHEQAGKAETQ